MDDWDAANYNGQRLIKFTEGNKTILDKSKAALNLDDHQMQTLVEYLKSHYPEATIKPLEDIQALEKKENKGGSGFKPLSFLRRVVGAGKANHSSGAIGEK